MASEVFLHRLEEIRRDEFQTLLSDADQPALDENFVLIGRRNLSTKNSWMHQVRKLSRAKKVRCTAMMNPGDAGRLSILDGEEVRVISRMGEIIIPVEISDAMMPGVLSIPHGFGHTRAGTRVSHAEAKPGVSVNDITDPERVDALTGNAAFSGQPVRVKKLASGARSPR